MPPNDHVDHADVDHESADQEVIIGAERLVSVAGIELCVQEFGDSGDPTILLISGVAASMDLWDEALCLRLAAGARHVVRYDHRDTGRSTGCPAGRPDYTGRRLVDDAAELIDVLGLRTVHLAGISAGGAIAQQLALLLPGRVRSLTLIATSPAVDVGRSLPGPVDPVRSFLASPAEEPDWSDRAAAIDHLVRAQRAFIGAGTFDLAYERRRAARVVDRTNDLAAATANHWLADQGEPVPGELSAITAPTLVLHGTVDPLFPIEHGEALVEAIRDTRLVALPRTGHQAPPRQLWPQVCAEMLQHTAPAEA